MKLVATISQETNSPLHYLYYTQPENCCPKITVTRIEMNFIQLQDISQHCRAQPPERPFSHTVMDLYNDVLLQRAAERQTAALPTTSQTRPTDTESR